MGHGIGYRDYQVEARDATFDEFESGTQSALVVMPTGTGKTVLGGMCCEEMICGHGKSTLFIAHRERLVSQAYKTFDRFGFDVAVEMAAQDALKQEALVGKAQVVVGSVQTLQDDRLMRWSPNSFGLIIIDECHRALADSYTKLLNWFDDYWLLGITATPTRGDRRNLGTRFAVKTYEYSLRLAIAKQWLSPIRVRTVPAKINLRGITLHGGDFNVGDLEERIGPKIEQLARAFAKQIGKRPAVAFLPDVGSAMAFAQVLSADADGLRIPARYVAGQGGAWGMGKAERNTNLDAFDAGEYQVIVCCELLIEGWDCPRVEAIGILRPTLQQYRYMQMVGRGTRPSPDTGKTDCLVVDFDWETDPDVKDLCSVIDIFDDGSLDREVYAVAKQIERQGAGDVDAEKVLTEAERIVRTRQRFNIRLTGKEAQYEAYEYDPIGVAKILDIPLKRKYDLDKRGVNPASEAQLGKLRSLGIVTPDGLSKWGASKMIGKLLKRQEQGMADARDVQKLLVAGVDPAYARAASADDARQALEEISAARITQKTFF